VLLRRRATQAECFDVPDRALEEVRSDYAWLARVNRLTHFDLPFRRSIPALLGESACRELELLDVGAGDGRLGESLEGWAAGRGWRWRVTNLDANPHCASISRRPVVQGSALALPFPDRAFDVVVATTMTHHLTDEEAIAHFREAGRVARRLVVIVDLHRNPLFAAAIWLLLTAWRAPRHFREDGVLSVRRGWRVAEWRELAARAGLAGARVRSFGGMQLVLTWQPSVQPAKAG
jgi:ubiquinone/menaquinone biosynthesis C-methylase UbiE